MALPLDSRVVFGLLYLWIRDSDLLLTPKTVRYIKRHCQALVDAEELEYSSEAIADFIGRNGLARWLVQRLRQFRPKARRTRAQRNARYGRSRPRANLTSLDKE